jgi:hypothetical protein
MRNEAVTDIALITSVFGMIFFVFCQAMYAMPDFIGGM